MAKYLVQKSFRNGNRHRCIEDLNASPSFWELEQKLAKKDNIRLIYRGEVVNGKRRIYYVLVDFPSGNTWEYFLISSKKNDYISCR